MISFFSTPSQSVIAVQAEISFTEETEKKLAWLFGEAEMLNTERVDRQFVGPRREMITPWSTCAVEITQNMGIEGITRIEEYTPRPENETAAFDPMLQRKYENLDQSLFTIGKNRKKYFISMTSQHITLQKVSH